LNLSGNKLKGIHWIFSAGTGIIPIFDLISLTLRFLVQKISLRWFKEKKNLLLPEEETFFFNNIEIDYKLNLCLTFKNPSYAIGLELIKQMKELDDEYNMNVFNFHIRYSDEEKWDERFLGDNVFKHIDKLIERVYIIGPSLFCKQVSSSLASFLNLLCKGRDSIVLI
jgi:hypothetical protein